MSINDSLQLFESLVVVSDRDSLVSEIDALKSKIFSVSSIDELEKSLTESVSEIRARELSSYLRKIKNKNYDGHIVQEFLEALRVLVMGLDVVTAYLPIELSKQELSEMHKKLVGRLNREILIDVRIEPSIIGGLRLELGGKYLDLSLLSSIRKMSSQA